MELILAVVGPVAGAMFGLGTFVVRRQVIETDKKLQAIAENVEVISHQVTSILVSMPTNYVSKDDHYRHIAEEERWQKEVLQQVHQIRDELSSVRINVNQIPH
jgi:hypothetical protein